MVRRLGGKRWQRLHQVVYVLSLLVLIHFFQQTKADVWLPTFVAGLFGWLMGYRILIWRKTERGELSTLTLVGLAVAITVLTFLAEAVGIGIAFNVSPLRVLETAFDFDPYSIRPGWAVLAAGLAVAAVDWVRARFAKPRRASAKPAPAKPVPAAAKPSTEVA
jgi:sulfoxide reductase heme-binding subunit YedZ